MPTSGSQVIASARARPVPQPPGRIGRVLLATDLTDTSGPATDEAIRLAAATGASLLAVSVIDPGSLRLPGGRFRERVDQVRTRREAAAQELVAMGHRHGVAVRFLIWQGEPGPSVLEAAESEDVDIVVVGSHGRGAVGRLVMGSVSEHIVRNARRPVMVVRQDIGSREDEPGRAGRAADFLD
jgi:nucleotide-binding universal stress UspA family protein